jgi:transcriptional regulator with XRE-family HTH domain
MTNTDAQTSSSPDDAFALALRAERERQGITQGALAEEMKTRGHDFRQQTMARIEKGDRRVSVGEAQDLAAALGTTLDELAPPRGESPAAAVRRTGNEFIQGLITTAMAVDETVRRQQQFWDALKEAQIGLDAEITMPDGSTHPSLLAYEVPFKWRALQLYKRHWAELLDQDGMKALLYSLGWDPVVPDQTTPKRTT